MAVISLEKAPRKARDLCQKAYGAMERGNLDYAMDMFESLLELEPRLLQARKYLRVASVRKAREKGGGSLTQTLSSIQGATKVMKVQGLCKKDPLKALALAEKLLRMDPLNKTFIKAYEQAALAAEMPEAAILAMEVVQDQYASDVDFLRRLATLYMDSGETRKGRECYEAVAKLRPSDQKAIKDLKDAAALDTMQKGGWTGASSYRDVMKDAKEATLLEQESKAVKSSDDAESLIQETLEKIEREPENVNYRRALADLFARQSRFDEALQTMEDVQARIGSGDPQIARTINGIRVRQFDKQIQDLEAAGNDAGAGQVREEKQTFLLNDAAERVRQYPNDLQFKFEYGTLLFERGQINEAIQQFQQAQRNPQRRLTALYYLGLCFKSKDQLDIAAEQLKKALSEMPTMDATKKNVLYELGELAESMDQPEEAAQYYKEIYAVDIGYKDIAQKIESGYRKST